MRQPILYAEQMWRAQRVWAAVLFLFGILGSVGLLVTQKGRIDSSVAIFLGYIPCALILGGLLIYYRRRSYTQVTDGGLKISNLLSSIVIGYDQVRSVRVQPLERHFQDGRKRSIRPLSKPLLPKPALFIRVRGDEITLSQLRRKLGSQLVAYDMIALPIPDPDAMAWEVTSKLPYRAGMNLGGQRRRSKRGR